MQFFCFGWGYSADYLGTLLNAKGWHLCGTVRSDEKAKSLRKQGIQAYVYDSPNNLSQKSEIENCLASSHAILNSIPPTNNEDPVIQNFSESLNLLNNKTWLGYLSTTGVYGDRSGEWVDEQSSLNAISKRGKARINCEKSWATLTNPTTIFRLAGIYGPKRNALETILKGKSHRIYKKGQLFSRIHVQDLATILLTAIETNTQNQIYNVCDNLAAPPQDVIEYACTLLKCQPPPLIPIEQANLSPIAQSFYAENKKVCNKKVKTQLNIHLQYPNYKLGLQKLFESIGKHN